MLSLSVVFKKRLYFLRISKLMEIGDRIDQCSFCLRKGRRLQIALLFLEVALTEKWAEIYRDKGVSFYSMHPGWAETPGVTKSLPDFSRRLSGNLRTSEEGADTVIWLVLQPKEKLVSGAFYFDRAEALKHLMFTATRGSHTAIDSIIRNLQSMSGLSS